MPPPQDVDAPAVQVLLRPGVEPGCLGSALEHLRARAALSLSWADRIEVRLARGAHPAMPTALLADASLHLGAHVIRASGIAADPHEAIDRVCERLAAKFDVVPRQRDRAFADGEVG